MPRRRPDQPARVLVVMPTYNGRNSLLPVAQRLHAAVPGAELLVVDDASPDGTGRLAEALSAREPWVHLLRMNDRAGPGAAYVAGFGWALEKGYDVLVGMDGGGSHAPEQLPRLLAALQSADVVLGSRWVAGGSVVAWPRLRELLSRAGNAWTRVALGLPVADVTGGYRAYRREVLESLPLHAMASPGCCFQMDLARQVWRSGYRVVEVPITVREPPHGRSTTHPAAVLEALWRVARWGVRSRRTALRT